MASKSPKWFSKLSKPFSGPSSESKDPDENIEKDSRARRREQILFRIFRTHRDRKATYIKTLESEVAKLRAKDAAHDSETQAYKLTIRRMKGLIKYHNIVLPLDLASDPHIQSPEATIELVGSPDHGQMIRAQLPEYLSYTSQISRAGITAAAAPVSMTEPNLTMNIAESGELLAGMTSFDTFGTQQEPRTRTFTGTSTTMPHPHGLGTTQTGIDFVLALEHVCLEHHAVHSVDMEGTGHEMMLMSPIMRYSPPLVQTTQAGSGLPDGTKWSVPAAELEKLLECADRLSLGGEMTPVEAWQRIRLHPNFGDLTREGLEDIKASLVPEVKCYGFGAVIDGAYFDAVVMQILGPSQESL
ncbi:hypothetical protein LTS15_002620 [Exophiala xenobiotica]|nr:hypothetical protein LTS15_002620 [Exophiala xenobiotica]